MATVPITKRDGPGLRQILIWGALNAISGHSKPIDRKPMSSYRKFTPKVVNKVSKYQPPPLTPALARRSGCITPPLQELEDDTREDTEFDQMQSPLFRLLPEEVLVEIYKYVLGRNVVHIVRRSRSLSHAACKSEIVDQDECRALKCRGTKLPNGVSLDEKGRNYGDFITLLQTCRKVYVFPFQTTLKWRKCWWNM